MSVNVTIAGTTFPFPTTGEEAWGSVVTNWAIAVSSQLLQRTGGSFSLTAEVDFGSTFATKQAYLKSKSANIASTGFARLARTDAVSWRNVANDANLPLTVDGSDRLTFNGLVLSTSAGGVLGPTAGGTGISSYTTGDTLYSSSTDVLAKLAIGTANYVYTSNGTIPAWALLVNANIDASAAIAFSKMAALTASKLLESSAGGVVTVATGTGYPKLSSGTPSYSATIPRADIAAGTADHVVINDGSGNLSSEAQLAVSRGGTNLGSYTSGDLLYASGSTTLSKLGVGSNGQVLKVASSLPSWGAATAAAATTTKVFADSPVTISNLFDVYAFDTSSGAIAATLPDCATNAGKIFYLKKTTSDTNIVTISRASSDTIVDAGSAVTSTTLNTIGEEIMIVSFGGTVWQVLNRRIPSIWTSYSASILGVGSNPAKGGTVIADQAVWRRVGDSIELQYTFRQTLGGSAGTGNYYWTIPNSWTADTSKTFAADNANQGQNLGSANAFAATVGGWGQVKLRSSTTMYIVVGTTTTDQAIISSTWFPLSDATAMYSFNATIAISGWNG